MAIAPLHLLTCGWELPLIAFERDSWVRQMLADPTQAEVYGNLDDVLITAMWPPWGTSEVSTTAT